MSAIAYSTQRYFEYELENQTKVSASQHFSNSST
jgi:hypothetical protein